MERSRLPLFRRRSKSKSPGGSPSVQPLEAAIVTTHSPPATSAGKIPQIKSLGPYSPQRKSPEAPVWAKRLKDTGDISPLHAKPKVPSPVRKVTAAWGTIKSDIWSPPPKGKNFKTQDVMVVANQDGKADKMQQIPMDSVKTRAPASSGEVRVSVQSSDSTGNDSGTIDSDLCHTKSVNNKDRCSDLSDKVSTIVCPPRILKPPTRGQSVNSDSSTSPHHDYVELDYAGIYEECLPSPDYTELNIASSSSPSPAQTSPKVPADSHPEQSSLKQQYSKVGQACQDNTSSEACPDHADQMVSSVVSCGNGCPCCVDINDALSEGEAQEAETDSETGEEAGLSRGQYGLDRRDMMRVSPHVEPTGACIGSVYTATAQVGTVTQQTVSRGEKKTSDIYRSPGDKDKSLRSSDTCVATSSHTICNDAYQSSDQSPDTDYYGSSQLSATAQITSSDRPHMWSTSTAGDGDVSFGHGSVSRPKSDEYKIDTANRLSTGKAGHSYGSWGYSTRDTNITRGLGNRDLTVSIPDSGGGSGPFSAPPHNISMNSIPEVAETVDYEHLPGHLLPGLLSPTQRGSFPRSASRRPSCGVRMVEIRAGIRQGQESPRGSTSDEFTSRESLRDSPRSSILRDSWESPRNSGIRDSPRSSFSHVSSRGSLRDFSDVSDVSRENSLKYPQDARATILDLTSRPPLEHATSSLPQDYSCHQNLGTRVPHISRSISDDPRLVQNVSSPHETAPVDPRLLRQTPKSCDNHPVQEMKGMKGAKTGKESMLYKPLSPTKRNSPSASPRNLNTPSLERGSPHVFQYGAEHLRAYGLVPSTDSKSHAQCTPVSGVSHATNTTTSMYYTSSSTSAVKTSPHWAQSPHSAHGIAMPPDVCKYTGGISRGQQGHVTSRSKQGIRSPTQLDSVYEHIYEEPANLLSPESCDESRMGSDYYSGSGTMTRSRSSMSYDALPYNSSNTLTKSSSSPSQFKSSELTAPHVGSHGSHDNSPTRSVQRLDNFGHTSRQLPETPRGQNIQHRKLPDPPQKSPKKGSGGSAVRSLASAYEQSATTETNVNLTEREAKLKYAQVKVIKRSKSPKSGLLPSKLSMMFLRKSKDRPKSTEIIPDKNVIQELEDKTQDLVSSMSQANPRHVQIPASSNLQADNTYQSGSSGFVSNHSLDKCGSGRHQCSDPPVETPCKKKTSRPVRPQVTSDITKEIKNKSGYYDVRTGSGDTMADIDLGERNVRTKCLGSRQVHAPSKLPGTYTRSAMGPQIQKARKGVQGLVRSRHGSGSGVQESGAVKNSSEYDIKGCQLQCHIEQDSSCSARSTGSQKQASFRKSIPSPKHIVKPSGTQPQRFRFPSPGPNNKGHQPTTNDPKSPTLAKNCCPPSANPGNTVLDISASKLKHEDQCGKRLDPQNSSRNIGANPIVVSPETNPSLTSHRSQTALKVKVGVGTQTEPALVGRTKTTLQQRTCQEDKRRESQSKNHVVDNKHITSSAASVSGPIPVNKGPYSGEDYPNENVDKSTSQGTLGGHVLGPQPMLVKPYASAGRAQNFLSKFGFSGKAPSSHSRQAPPIVDSSLAAIPVLPQQPLLLPCKQEDTREDGENDGLVTDRGVVEQGKLMGSLCHKPDEKAADELDREDGRGGICYDGVQDVKGGLQGDITAQPEQLCNTNPLCTIEDDEEDVYEMQCYEHQFKGDYQKLDPNLTKTLLYDLYIPQREYQSLDPSHLSCNKRKKRHDYTRLRPNSWAPSGSHSSIEQPSAIQLEPQDLGSDSYQLLNEVTYVGQGQEIGDIKLDGFGYHGYSLAGSMHETSSPSESYQCLDVIQRDKVDMPSQTSLESSSRPESMTQSSQELGKVDNESINRTLMMDVDMLTTEDDRQDTLFGLHTPPEHCADLDKAPLHVTVTTPYKSDNPESDLQGLDNVSEPNPVSDSMTMTTQTTEQTQADGGSACINPLEMTPEYLQPQQSLFAPNVDPDTQSTGDSQMITQPVIALEDNTSHGKSASELSEKKVEDSDVWWDDELSPDNKGETDKDDAYQLAEVIIEERTSYRDVSPKDCLPEVEDSLIADGLVQEDNNRSRGSAPGDIICHYALQDQTAVPLALGTLLLSKPQVNNHLTQITDDWPSLPDMTNKIKGPALLMDPVQYGSLDRRKVAPATPHQRDQVMPHVLSDDVGHSDGSDLGMSRDIWGTFNSGVPHGASVTVGADPGALGNLHLSESGYDSWKSHDSSSVAQGSRDMAMTLNDHVIQENLYLLQNPDDDENEEDRDSLVWRDKDSDKDTVTLSTLSLEMAGCSIDPDDSIDSEKMHTDWLSQDTLLGECNHSIEQSYSGTGSTGGITHDALAIEDIEAVSNNNIVSTGEEVTHILGSSVADPGRPMLHDNMIDEQGKCMSEGSHLTEYCHSGPDSLEPGTSLLNGPCIYNHPTNGHIPLPDQISTDSAVDTMTGDYYTTEGVHGNLSDILLSPNPQGFPSNEIMFIADSKARFNDGVTDGNKYSSKQQEDSEIVAIALTHSGRASPVPYTCTKSRTNEAQVLKGSSPNSPSSDCLGCSSEGDSSLEPSLHSSICSKEDGQIEEIMAFPPVKHQNTHERYVQCAPDCQDVGGSSVPSAQGNLPITGSNIAPITPGATCIDRSCVTIPQNLTTFDSCTNTQSSDSAENCTSKNGSMYTIFRAKEKAKSAPYQMTDSCNRFEPGVNNLHNVVSSSDVTGKPGNVDTMWRVHPTADQQQGNSGCQLSVNEQSVQGQRSAHSAGMNHITQSEERAPTVRASCPTEATLLAGSLSSTKQSTEQTDYCKPLDQSIGALSSDDLCSDKVDSHWEALVSSRQREEWDIGSIRTMASLLQTFAGTPGTVDNGVESSEGERFVTRVSQADHSQAHKTNERSTDVIQGGDMSPGALDDRTWSIGNLAKEMNISQQQNKNNLSEVTPDASCPASQPGLQGAILPVLNLSNMPLYSKPDSPPTPRSNSSPLISPRKTAREDRGTGTFLTGESGLKRTRALSHLNVQHTSGISESPKLQETAVSETSLHVGESKTSDAQEDDNSEFSCTDDLTACTDEPSQTKHDRSPMNDAVYKPQSTLVVTKYGRQPKQIPSLLVDVRKAQKTNLVRMDSQTTGGDCSSVTPNSANPQNSGSPHSRITPPSSSRMKLEKPMMENHDQREPPLRSTSNTSKNIAGFVKTGSPGRTSQPSSPIRDRNRATSGVTQHKPQPRRPPTDPHRQLSEQSRTADSSQERPEEKVQLQRGQSSRNVSQHTNMAGVKKLPAQKSVAKSMSSLVQMDDSRLRKLRKSPPDLADNSPKRVKPNSAQRKTPGLMTRSAESGGSMNIRSAASHQSLVAPRNGGKVNCKSQNTPTLTSVKSQSPPANRVSTGGKSQSPPVNRVSTVGKRESPVRIPKSKVDVSSLRGNSLDSSALSNVKLQNSISAVQRAIPSRERSIKNTKATEEIPCLQSDSTRKDLAKTSSSPTGMCSLSQSHQDDNQNSTTESVDQKTPKPGVCRNKNSPSKRTETTAVRSDLQDPNPTSSELKPKCEANNPTSVQGYAVTQNVKVATDSRQITADDTSNEVTTSTQNGASEVDNVRGALAQTHCSGTPVLRPGIKRQHKSANKTRLPSYKQIGKDKF